ncbi:MAG: hypothetical protein Unbinned8596contig1000_52 [Prokaryotic dsDNA virus sp.]|nr:MAG: hypothetical protein Unbinned8596contig1000_52 [Prokaryotic dsDNA virus sp.]|tara:strand:+ start:24727 stop:27360 length:2634 start_codon:yes stop_codon:yes gene_type:complete
MGLVYNKFNRGEIDDLLLAREDVTRVSDSAELMNNFIPSRMGPMIYRPGMQFLDEVNNDDIYFVPFFASRDSTALLEFSDQTLRIWANDELVSASSTSDTVVNGDFSTDLSGWSVDNDTGASVIWNNGTARFKGTGIGQASIYQTINSTDLNSEHTLEIIITEAPVTLAIGTDGAGSDDIFEGSLSPGYHSLVFTPESDVTLTLSSRTEYYARVDSIQFVNTGVVTLPTRITSDQISSIRHTQSADVVFIAYDNGQQYRVERRGVKSWSITNYQSNDGPFGFINNSDVTLRATSLSGNGSLIASSKYFTPEHVGTLYKLISSGQTVTQNVTAEDSGTNGIRVTGVETERQFNISVNLSGAAATVTLQRSTDEVTWTDLEDYTSNTFKSYDDELDNSILYYRLHVKSGAYTSGTVRLSLTYSGGSIEGVARVTGYTNETTVTIQIYQDFGSTSATRDWYEGQWSEFNGYPSSVALYEGRLWWAGKRRLWGSVSDAYTSFDDSLEGGDAPVQRTIGFGPVDVVDWLAISSRLLMGVASDEISVRSSSFGETLTDTNTNLKSGSSQGVASIEPVRIDDDILFVQRARKRLFRLTYDTARDSHRAMDMLTLNQSIINNSMIRKIAVVRQPETRVFAILENGNGLVLTYDSAEDVKAWSRFSTNGDMLDIVVLPSDGEDKLYIVVRRDNGTFLERLSDFENVEKYPYDSHKRYESPGSLLSGLEHLANMNVKVWADGQILGDYTVSQTGALNIGASYSNVVVGLSYTAEYISNKLSGFVRYSTLTTRKRVTSVGMVARDICREGFLIGSSVDNLYPLPKIERGQVVELNQLTDEYDEPSFEFSGSLDVDSRVHIKCEAPCKIMALVYEIEESEIKDTDYNQG